MCFHDKSLIAYELEENSHRKVIENNLLVFFKLLQIYSTHTFQVIFDYQIHKLFPWGWDFTFIGKTLTHVQTWALSVESPVTRWVAAMRRKSFPWKPRYTQNTPTKAFMCCFRATCQCHLTCWSHKISSLTHQPPFTVHITTRERGAWSAALLNQQLPWTIQFSLDSPEACTQPQSVLEPCRHLWWLATLEELLNFWPQSTGLEPQHQGHLKGRDKGGVHCYLVHSA